MHSSTKVAPNLLVFGRLLRMPSEINISFPDALPSNLQVQIGHLVKTINNYQELAEQNLTISRAKMKAHYDKTSQDVQFSPGELVWL